MSELFTDTLEKVAIDFAAVRLSRRAQTNENEGETDLKTKILGLIAVGLLATSVPAVALTLQGTTSSATGISGLLIGGTTYDVTFSATTFNSPFGGFGSTGATVAAIAVAQALNSLGVTSLAGAPVSLANSGYSQLLVYTDDGSTQLHTGAYNNQCASNSFACMANGWVRQDGFYQPLGYFRRDTGVSSFDYYTVAANFARVASVPEPGSLALLGLGLAGLGLSRRRKAH